MEGTQEVTEYEFLNEEYDGAEVPDVRDPDTPWISGLLERGL